jgi:hypothetical protein
MKAYFQFFFFLGGAVFLSIVWPAIFSLGVSRRIIFRLIKKTKKLVGIKNLMLLDQILLHLQLDQKHKI